MPWVHPPPGVGEITPGGMENQTRGWGAAVAAIADDRMSDRLHVNPQLMHAARGGLQPYEGAIGDALDHSPGRPRRLPAFMRHRARALRQQRRVDHALIGLEDTGDPGEVVLPHPALAESRVELPHGGAGAGEEQDARGPLVETMHQPDLAGTAVALAQLQLQRLERRAGGGL